MTSQVCVVYDRSCDVIWRYAIKPWVKLVELASFTFSFNLYTEFTRNRRKYKYL